MALSKRLRFAVLHRDGFTCRYCGARPPHAVLHVDHLVAQANGGTDDPENLVTSCRSCNLGKATSPIAGVEAEVAVVDPMWEITTALLELVHASTTTIQLHQIYGRLTSTHVEELKEATSAGWAAVLAVGDLPPDHSEHFNVDWHRRQRAENS